MSGERASEGVGERGSRRARESASEGVGERGSRRARESASEGVGERGSQRARESASDITHKYIGVLTGLLVKPVLKTNIFLYL
jgi:hypothetical protein